MLHRRYRESEWEREQCIKDERCEGCAKVGCFLVALGMIALCIWFVFVIP